MATNTRTARRAHTAPSGRADHTTERPACTRTNIVLDDALIAEARELTGLHAKREIVEEALRTLVRVQKQRQGLALFGKLHWDGDLQQIRQGRGLSAGE